LYLRLLRAPAKQPGAGFLRGETLREKDYLYDLLVHDLVGSLAVISATVNGLLGKTERYGAISQAQREGLERVQRNTQKAQGLVQDILEVARSEENLFQSSRFGVRELVREAIIDTVEHLNPDLRDQITAHSGESELGRLLSNNGISWAVSGRYADAPFSHDRNKVSQIVRNLVSNAMKYRDHRMDIAVSGDADLVIAVSNDGPGIPEQDRQIVFNRFARAQNENVKDVPGLGLGLFCIKALVDRMHGEIALGSREGFRTCFTVRIPLLPPSKEKEGR
jgi:signal transduction histidine kinase